MAIENGWQALDGLLGAATKIQVAKHEASAAEASARAKLAERVTEDTDSGQLAGVQTPNMPNFNQLVKPALMAGGLLVFGLLAIRAMR